MAMQRQALALSLLPLAAALLAPSARAADETVTIYGVADVYAQAAQGDRTELSLQSGGLSGSRLGFKGSRDVGDGLSGLFRFEMGLAVDQGVSTQGGRLFGRQAFVGLSGGFGTVSAGRQYLPHFNAVDNFDPFSTGAGSGASSGIVSLLAARADNSVVYDAPKMGAFSLSAMAALAESGSSNSNGNIYSANLDFAQGPLDLGLAFVQKTHAAAGDPSSSIVLLAGSYDAGAVKVMGGVQVVKDGTGAAATDDDRTEFFVGVAVPMGAKDTLSVGGYSGKTKNVSGSQATQLSLGWTHSLGKGLDAYVVLSDIGNGTATAFTTDSATGAGPAVSAGQDVKGGQVGVRYRF